MSQNKEEQCLHCYLTLPQVLKPQISTLRKAIDEYGAKAQVDMAIEEMSELTKALLKLRRSPIGNNYQRLADISEETADVIIMLTQLVIIYDNWPQVQIQINNKVKRLMHRLLYADSDAAQMASDNALQSATQIGDALQSAT